MRTANDAILSDYGAFLVGTSANLPYADLKPFGIETNWVIDPTRMQSAVFMDLLQSLDGLTFGPEGMPMDKWVFYDCADLPGFIYGFAAPVATLSAEEKRLFKVPDGYEGPVPFSMYIAIPMHEEGTWFGHNLASLNRIFPARKLGGLGTITKAVALKAFRVQRFVGATQWLSNALYVHIRFGSLDLVTAYTPAHSVAETLTYAFDVNDEVLRLAAGDPSIQGGFPEPTMHLDGNDVDAMKALQAQIEGGKRYRLVGPPDRRDGSVFHPIAELASSA